MRFSDLPRAGRAYLLGTYALAASLVLLRQPDWSSADWWIFATLAIAAGVAHLFPVSSVEHRQAYHVSLPFFIAAALLLPAGPLALLVLLVHLAEWIRRPKRSWFAQSFNLAVYIVGTSMAQVGYHWLWSGPIDLSAPLCVLGAAVAVVQFGFLNRVLVSGVLWLCNGVAPSQQQLLFDREGLFIDTLLLAMGVPLARLGQDVPWAIVLGATPALLIHRVLDLPNIRAQARRDSATQLATRAAFQDACGLELSRARHFGRPLALVVLEIDGFDELASRLGHKTTEALLRDVAGQIRASARNYDVPARLGRAEFGLLLPESDASGARSMARHLERALDERGFDVPGTLERLRINVRTGVACVQSDGVSVDELLERAYAALNHEPDVHHVKAAPTSNVEEDAPSVRSETPAPPLPPNERSRRRTVALLSGVAVCAAATFVWALPYVASVDPLALGFLILLVALGEVLTLQLFDRSTFSISVAPCLAAGMLLGVGGIVVVAPVSAILRGVYRRIRWYKVVFNASTYVLAGVAATLVYGAVAPTLDSRDLLLLLVSAGVAGLAYYAHTALVALAMATEKRCAPVPIWIENFGWLWPQYVALGVMGLFLALGYVEFGVLGAAVFALPPLMLRVVSKQYVAHTADSVRQLRELNDQLTHQAFHDPLTRLANRARLTDRVQQALTRATRARNAVAVLFIDLDNFKAVNDSLGHAVGDQLLVAVTERLRASIRATDTAARLGGDEFAVLLEELDQVDEAVHAAERVLDSLQAPFVLSEREVFVGASVGIALSHPGTTDADELLRNADVAMYAAKERGKGRYELFESRLHTAVLDRLALEAELRTAVERDELVVYYQPTLRLATGEVAGMEALVRWNHPKRGMVPPLEFIGSAESTGLIVPIGRQVLREACRQLREWQCTVPGAERLTVAVNLSARQLQEPSLPDDVAAALTDSGLAASSLVLEITESLLMQDAEATVERLRALKALGVGLAIDDFGTGYSSLSYLRRFPVDILKIDRSFVSGVGGGSQDAVLTEAIIALARTLHLTVVAEGIEHADQLRFLRELGCQLGQGYYFSRPLSADAMNGFLADARLVRPRPLLRAA